MQQPWSSHTAPLMLLNEDAGTIVLQFLTRTDVLSARAASRVFFLAAERWSGSGKNNSGITLSGTLKHEYTRWFDAQVHVYGMCVSCKHVYPAAAETCAECTSRHHMDCGGGTRCAVCLTWRCTLCSRGSTHTCAACGRSACDIDCNQEFLQILQRRASVHYKKVTTMTIQAAPAAAIYEMWCSECTAQDDNAYFVLS